MKSKTCYETHKNCNGSSCNLEKRRAIQLPKMNCQFGAPMGRKGTIPENPHVPRRMHLVRVRLDSGGYDSGGAYWGHGAPLYWATDSGGADYTADVFLRAQTREGAKAEVLRQIPGATFFR